MKKSVFITIVVICTIILLLIGWYLFFPRTTQQGVGDQTQTTPPLFGDIGTVPGLDDGNNQNQDRSQDQATSTQDERFTDINEPGYKIIKIGDYPVASVQALDFRVGTSSTSTLVVSVGKDSGTIRLYDHNTQSTSLAGSLNIPHIVRSEFTRSGTYVVVQSQDKDTLKTFILKTTPRTPTEERIFTPVFTSTAVSSFFIDNNSIYLIEQGRSTAELYQYDPERNQKTVLYRGFITELYGYAVNSRVFIGTKPAQNLEGFFFEINRSRNQVVTVLNGTALTAFPHKLGNKILSTIYTPRRITSQIFDITTRENTPLELVILKEKCVSDEVTRTFVFCGVPQNPLQDMPDAWYMGRQVTDDLWHIIDVESGVFDTLPDTNERIDVMYPHSSRNTGIISFINKVDLTPWIIVVE